MVFPVMNFDVYNPVGTAIDTGMGVSKHIEDLLSSRQKREVEKAKMPFVGPEAEAKMREQMAKAKEAEIMAEYQRDPMFAVGGDAAQIYALERSLEQPRQYGTIDGSPLDVSTPGIIPGRREGGIDYSQVADSVTEDIQRRGQQYPTSQAPEYGHRDTSNLQKRIDYLRMTPDEREAARMYATLPIQEQLARIQAQIQQDKEIQTYQQRQDLDIQKDLRTGAARTAAFATQAEGSLGNFMRNYTEASQFLKNPFTPEVLDKLDPYMTEAKRSLGDLIMEMAPIMRQDGSMTDATYNLVKGGKLDPKAGDKAVAKAAAEMYNNLKRQQEKPTFLKYLADSKVPGIEMDTLWSEYNKNMPSWERVKSKNQFGEDIYVEGGNLNKWQEFLAKKGIGGQSSPQNMDMAQALQVMRNRQAELMAKAGQ